MANNRFKKGPNCGPCGSYACQNLAFFCDGCGHAVFTDRCLTEEIRAIRSKGVRTLGCCCGHGEKLGYIQVMPEDVPIMELLGYEQQQEIELEDGFEWLEADAVRTCVYVFRRMSSAEVMLCLFNFSDRPQVYTYPGRGKETLELVMDSDDRCYGGSTASPVKKIRVTDSGCTFELPAFSGRCYTQKKTE